MRHIIIGGDGFVGRHLAPKLIADGATSLPITHPEMTRFWITLQDGVNFVIKSFERMYGGEIFVPKIPSVRIVDLARALGPELKQEIVGIRPGEKLHEVMCPADDSHLTLEFEDHFVLRPSIKFFGRDIDYATDRLGQKGREVPMGYDYNSGTNPHFLDIEGILEVNRQIGL